MRNASHKPDRKVINIGLEEYSLFEITDKNIWDDLIFKSSTICYFQLWHLGELAHRLYGVSVKRILITLRDEPALLAQIIKIRQPNQCYLNVISGPIIVNNHYDSLKVLVAGLREDDFSKDADFLKIEPAWEYRLDLQEILVSFGFEGADNYLGVNDDGYIYLDLKQDSESLWKQMDQSTRRHINKASHGGVTIRRAITGNDFDIFWNLLQKTSLRKRFPILSHEWYKSVYKSDLYTSSINQAAPDLFLAEYKDEAIAAALFLYYQGTAIYYRGGSLIESGLSGLRLLLWHAIREAKKIGCSKFNLGGFNSTEMMGLAQFKKGFGGEEHTPIGTYDYYFK